MRKRKQLRRPKLMQSGFDDARTRLNQEEVLLEMYFPHIMDFIDGAYSLNKTFCISFGDHPNEVFFDLLSDNASGNKVAMKPFRKRRL